jgi:DNA-directed RNA polymerase subunit RPC12/RpoP
MSKFVCKKCGAMANEVSELQGGYNLTSFGNPMCASGQHSIIAASSAGYVCVKCGAKANMVSELQGGYNLTGFGNPACASGQHDIIAG